MDSIKSYILAHDLKPGDPLPTEAELCEQLRVSRSSVREALRKLEALDIVRVQQGRGSFVGEMSLQPMVETLVLRNAMADMSQVTGKSSLAEVVSARRFLDRGIAEELTSRIKGTSNPELHELVNKMMEKSQNGQAYLEEDIAFHEALLDVLDNELLKQLTSAMWLVHQAIIPTLDIPKTQEMIAAAQAHGKMLEAAEAGDLAAYLKAVDDHYGPLARLIEAKSQSEKE